MELPVVGGSDVVALVWIVVGMVIVVVGFFVGPVNGGGIRFGGFVFVKMAEKLGNEQ